VERLVIRPCIVKRELGRIGVTFLNVRFVKVNATSENSRRGSGLESTQSNSGFLEVCRQSFCNVIAKSSSFGLILANVHQCSKESTGCYDDCFAMKSNAQGSLYASAFAILDDQAIYQALEQAQIRGKFEQMLHAGLVGFLVALSPGGLNGRSLGSIEQPELYGRKIRIQCHFTPKSINFPHHLTLGLATDCRIAAHLGYRIEIAGEQENVGPKPGGGQCGFASGVACAAYDHVVWIVRVSFERVRQTHLPMQN